MKITKKNAIEAYKGFDMNLSCRGFKYEVGKSYHVRSAVRICEKGFHACRKLYDVRQYYALSPNHRFCKVRLWGDVETLRDKLCASNIEILEEIPYAVLLSILNLGSDNTGLFNVGNGNLGDCNFGHYNIGNHNIGDYNDGADNLGRLNQGNSNIGDHNTGHYNIGCYNKGSYNVGDLNYGSFNKGNHNTGWFNTQSWDDYRWFDKPAEPVSAATLSALGCIHKRCYLSSVFTLQFRYFEFRQCTQLFYSEISEMQGVMNELRLLQLPNWDERKALTMLYDYSNHYNKLQTELLSKAREVLNTFKKEEQNETK